MELWEKSQTVDHELRAYVSSLVNAVGGSSNEDDTYQIGDDALAALRDLEQWLRLYDDKLDRYDVKRCIAEANLVQGDLLPILAQWPEEATENRVKARLALACLQLLVPLTWPMVLEEEKTTKNHVRHMPFLQLAQVAYKRALMHFEHADILRTVVRIALPAMASERRERSRRDESIIKLVMYLLRNVALITQPQRLPSLGDENEITRSSTIDAFHQQDVFALLLTIGSGASTEFEEQDVILLEILFHLVKGVDPQKLFIEQQETNTTETHELQRLMQQEKAMHKHYAKHAPSRHNRFGTMTWLRRDDTKVSTLSGQHAIAGDSMTLQRMDASKAWNKPKYRGNASANFDEQSDIGTNVDLTESARTHLRSFVADFVDGCFNPLFSSVRKAIERERDRVQSAHVSQYFYLVSWFLSAEEARRATRATSLQHNGASAAADSSQDDNNFVQIAAVLDQDTFAFLNRQMQRSLDDKSWQDVQATLLCFTQILLTVQAMAESKDEEDQEIAENIQSRIFYEESTHDRIVAVLRGYTTQGFAYLDAVTECTHVFVRMLERYSKQNVDLHIRSKRRARRKQSQQQEHGGDNEGIAGDDGHYDTEDEQEAHRTVRERKFDFSRFAAKVYGQQKCIDAFLAFLQFHPDLTPARLKRCHRFLYNLAFKHENAILLFRVDILLLLQRIVKSPQALDTDHDAYKEWEQLVLHVFRRCVKWLTRETEGQGWMGLCVTEMLFSKMSGSMFYLKNGYERVIEPKAPRAPAELVFKPFVEDDQRIPIAVGLLIAKAEAGSVGWVVRELQRISAERQRWSTSQETQQARAAGEEKEPPIAFLHPDTEERKIALFKDKHLRLLLTTVGCKRLGAPDEVDAAWVLLPESELGRHDLAETVLEIKRAEESSTLLLPEGRTAEDCVRNKSSMTRNATFSDSDSADEAGDEGLNEPLFPPNERERSKDGTRPPKRRRLTKRKRREISEEEAKERAVERRRKDKERLGKIKSQLRVTASDDESDEERDREFFAQEEDRRKKMAGIIRSALLQHEKKNGGRKPKKRKRKTVDNDDDDEIADDGSLSDIDSEADGAADVGLDRNADAEIVDVSDGTTSDAELDNGDGEQEKEETPSTSPPAEPLREVSGNIASLKGSRIVAEDSDEEDDLPVIKPGVRRQLRAGFVVESDSDE